MFKKLKTAIKTESIGKVSILKEVPICQRLLLQHTTFNSFSKYGLSYRMKTIIMLSNN